MTGTGDDVSEGDSGPPAALPAEHGSPVVADPVAGLRHLTPARIGLGRVGASLPTREVLAFALAHARARDAVHAPFDPSIIEGAIKAAGHPVVRVASRAPTRDVYLRRPDLGRRLAEGDIAGLKAASGDHDIVIVVGDGLSATAVHHHAPALLQALLPKLRAYRLAPLVVATGTRVALGDEIGEALGARLAIMLIGERPGLSAPDSLGAYITHGPRRGRTDAERNCVSNIRPEGLAPDRAATTIAWLAREALRRSTTGIDLMDQSGGAVLLDG